MNARRVRLGAVAMTLAGVGFLFVPSLAQERPPEGSAPLTELHVIEKVRGATDKALRYLERKQEKQGANAGGWSANHAINSLAMLAFLSSGHVPGRGEYGDQVEDGVLKPGVLTRAKKFLLKSAQPTGYISSSSMYEHGLSTLCLAEMYGMDADPELEEKLRKAVELIVKCQSPAGGWRYNPAPQDQDLSVTVMQIVALRASSNAGIAVDRAVIDKAITYVKNCAPPNGPGFGYSGPATGPQTTPAGILSLQLLIDREDNKPETKVIVEKLLPSSLDHLAMLKPGWPGQVQYFYYHHYYAIQAMYQAGGKHWNDWHPQVRELLLSKQNADGSWDVPPGTSEVGYSTPESKVYPTAIATLVLNIYLHYLPAYQR